MVGPNISQSSCWLSGAFSALPQTAASADTQPPTDLPSNDGPEAPMPDANAARWNRKPGDMWRTRRRYEWVVQGVPILASAPVPAQTCPKPGPPVKPVPPKPSCWRSQDGRISEIVSGFHRQRSHGLTSKATQYKSLSNAEVSSEPWSRLPVSPK